MIFNFFRQLQLHKNSDVYKRLQQILLYTLGINILFAVLFKNIEQVSWNEAIWQTWQTATTVGYGNKPAETLAGRIITMLLSTVSIAFVGALFGAVFDYREHHKTQKKLGFMNNPYKDGYVVFNFPGINIAKHFIDELRAVEHNVGICFVDNHIETLPDEIASLPNIHFLKGSPLQQQTYTNAQVNKNKTIIVFPVHHKTSTSDGSTKTTIDLLERFITSSTRVLFVLVDQSNAWMFDTNNATHVNADLSILAIVQECQDPYSAKVIEDLLYNTQGANPMTVTVNKLAGISWKDFQINMMHVLSDYKFDCNVLSIIRDGQSNSCPKPSEILEKGDLLSIATYDEFPWEDFEEKIIELQS
ncbi:hypothetical protein EI427_14745 [Flammeovirga pectinis]|uniref:Potassium channel domain-containing protein n=1 Tax=Flammeovirga pectinis TaxID=2494373 RepID=A0A3Q9FS33_9BACT|nr:potassium channel family protein [Flammeovirga pectinis]AZQ63443.1 hypothetical protein EI427_14745 [Flammeovirga pectinis]